MLDPAELVACIQQWLEDLGRELGKHVAIDGKTLRGSGDKAAGRNPLHLAGIGLGQRDTLDAGDRLPSTRSPTKSRRFLCCLELLDLKGA